MTTFIIKANNGNWDNEQADTNLETVMLDLLNTYWEEQYNPGCTVFSGHMVQATLTTCHYDDATSGVVHLTRYDGAFPVSQLYRVAYLLNSEGDYYATDINAIEPDAI